MRNSIAVELVEGMFVVRITEDGKTTEKEFSREDHARSWASGQSLRLANTLDLVTDDLAQAYGHMTSITSSVSSRTN
jgi:hypothetical protein